MNARSATGENYKNIAMACQGGGSLGAYHVGALEAMQAEGYEPTCLGGISIGAFTAAIIVGNKPKDRVHKLERFWNLISWPDVPPAADGAGFMKKWHNFLSSWQGFVFGQPAFFRPRFPPPFFQPAGTPAATSFYDTDLLRETLSKLVDFDLVNDRGNARLILGTTRVRDGAPRWFDSHMETIGPEHIMASGAMPPGFPAIRIEDELYWDGGCYSNTPLDGLYDALRGQGDTLCFVIDLFGPNGREPQDISEVSLTLKEIQFSNRSRRNINRLAERHNHAHWLRHIMERYPEAINGHPHREEILRFMQADRFDLVHILYQKPAYEVATCDCEFSRASIADRRRQGCSDMKKALAGRRQTAASRLKMGELAPVGATVETFAKGIRVD